MRAAFFFLFGALVAACGAHDAPAAKPAATSTPHAIEIFAGVDGACYTDSAGGCAPYAGYEDRETVITLAPAELAALETALTNAAVWTTPEGAAPIFDLPPQTYEVRLVADGHRTSARFWHAPGRGLPRAAIDAIAALPASERPKAIDVLVAQNRALLGG